MPTTALVLAILATAPTERVLTIHTPSGDIDERQAGLFEAHLRIELAKHQGLEVVRATAAESSALDEQCVEKPACLARLAQGVGADIVVFVRTARLGGDSIVTMKRLRILTGEIEQTSTRSIEGGKGGEMLVALGPMVTELFPGRMVVSGAQTGVTRDDALRWSPPPVKPWMFWTGVGATAVSAGCIGIFAYKSHEAKQRWDDTVNGSAPGNVPGEVLVDAGGDAERWARRTNIAIGTTIGLGVGTAILGYFTDWNEGRDVQLMVGPGGAGVQGRF